VLVWGVYVLPMWVSGQARYVGRAGWMVAEFWVYPSDRISRWLWRDWAGWAGPHVIMCRATFLSKGGRTIERVRRHEIEHCKQQFRWGLLFYPAYLCASIWIWLRPVKHGRLRHSYFDNPFEIAARRAAGQQIVVPPEDWPTGKHDRWIWW
jgi:hypothetical protein